MKGWRRLSVGETVNATDIYRAFGDRTGWRVVSEGLPHMVGEEVPKEHALFHHVFNRYEGADSLEELRRATNIRIVCHPGKVVTLDPGAALMTADEKEGSAS